MEELLVFAIFTSLLVKGFHAVTRDGMALSFLGFDEEKLERKRDILRRERDELIELVEEEYNIRRENTKGQVDTKEYEDRITIYRKNCEYKLGKLTSYGAWTKPWSECEVCMSSFWGTLVFIITNSGSDINWETPAIYAGSIIITAGILSLIKTSKNE